MMRLWSLHPKHLDSKGLVALWREALLAQKVLRGETKGYRNHPQLLRFKKHAYPKRAIASYLVEVWKEAKSRGYHFQKNKILRNRTRKKILVTIEQLKYEHQWLCLKVKARTPSMYPRAQNEKVETNPVFRMVPGKVEIWERVKT